MKKVRKVKDVYTYDIEELIAILAAHEGIEDTSNVELLDIQEEDFDSWSGQVWDDGPLDCIFKGIQLTYNKS